MKEAVKMRTTLSLLLLIFIATSCFKEATEVPLSIADRTKLDSVLNLVDKLVLPPSC